MTHYHELHSISRIDQGGRELLVAVNFELEASKALAERRNSSQMNHWEAYAKLFKKVTVTVNSKEEKYILFLSILLKSFLCYSCSLFQILVCEINFSF